MSAKSIESGQICLLCEHVFKGPGYQERAKIHGGIPVRGLEHKMGEVFLSVRIPDNPGKGFIVIGSEVPLDPDHLRRYFCLSYLPSQNVPGAIRPAVTSPIVASPTQELFIEEPSPSQFKDFMRGIKVRLDAHYIGGDPDRPDITSLGHIQSYYPLGINLASPQLTRGVLPR